MSAPTILDPVCDMVVELADARDHGLTIERPERAYGFCSHGCLVKFAKSPQGYVAKVDAWLGANARGEHVHPNMAAHVTPVIDAGMREW